MGQPLPLPDDSPYPPGSTYTTIFVNADGQPSIVNDAGVVPTDAVAGETVVYLPNGDVETTVFSLNGEQPSIFKVAEVESSV